LLLLLLKVLLQLALRLCSDTLLELWLLANSAFSIACVQMCIVHCECAHSDILLELWLLLLLASSAFSIACVHMCIVHCECVHSDYSNPQVENPWGARRRGPPKLPRAYWIGPLTQRP